MTDTWAAKVLADVPKMTSHGHPGASIEYDDALAAIAKLGAGDDMVERLNRADEYEPLGHDGWEAAAHIAALTEQLAAARRDADKAEAYVAELEANGLANRVAIMRLDAKLAKAVEALDSVMVGGNHLATILPDNFPPSETEPLIALETVGYGYGYEVWCCWRSIMLARTTLAELTGGKDE